MVLILIFFESSGGSCPASHPYVYYNGHYCCRTNREKHYKPQGSKCDGSVIHRTSLCCAGDKYTKCPKGICSNYKKTANKKVAGHYYYEHFQKKVKRQ